MTIADRMAGADPAVTVVHRTEKAGLGAAYLNGFAVALEAGYDVIGEMDADGSHQPEQLHRLLDALRDADLVIGSRYVPGGSVVNWPLQRLRSRAAATSTYACCSASRSRTRRRASGCSVARRWSDRPCARCGLLATSSRPTSPTARCRGAEGRRGADRVHRARARGLQDERLRSRASRSR